MTLPKLAIVAPHIGAPSETFIMRHMAELAPGRSLVIVNSIHPLALKSNWGFPFVEVNSCWQSFSRKLFRFVLRSVGLWQPHHLLLTFPAAETLQNAGITTILGEYLHHTCPWIKIAKQLNIPIMGHAHGIDVSQMLKEKKWRRKYLDYNDTAGIITMSEESRQQLIGIGINQEKIFVVPYGVKIPQNITLEKRPLRDSIRCLAVGRMVEKKAPLKLLEAFHLASKKTSNLTLDYIGDGPLMLKVKDFIKKHDLTSKITLHGLQSNDSVYQLMENSDIFLQHSIIDPVTGDKEGLPVAILEAMAHGLPVISTLHAGIPEAIIDGENGILVGECDYFKMGESISRLATDRNLRISMGNMARRKAVSTFSWNLERNKLRKLLLLEQ